MVEKLYDDLQIPMGDRGRGKEENKETRKKEKKKYGNEQKRKRGRAKERKRETG